MTETIQVLRRHGSQEFSFAPSASHAISKLGGEPFWQTERIDVRLTLSETGKWALDCVSIFGQKLGTNEIGGVTYDARRPIPTYLAPFVDAALAASR